MTSDKLPHLDTLTMCLLFCEMKAFVKYMNSNVFFMECFYLITF